MLSYPEPQDPNADLDYKFDWSQWLQEGETLVESEFLCEQSIVIDRTEIEGGFTKYWVTGGLPGEVCHIVNRVTSSQGRKDDNTARLRIRDK